MCCCFCAYLHLGHSTNLHCPHWCIICPVTQNPVVNLVIHLCCFMVIPFTTVCTVVQSMDSMSIPQNQVLLVQYSWAACLQVWSSNLCFTSVLIFLFSSHSSHGSPRRQCIVGSGFVCIFCQWFFATLSMASFHRALSHMARATWSWCPLMCLLVHFYLCLVDASSDCVYDVELFVQWVACPLFHTFCEGNFPITYY